MPDPLDETLEESFPASDPPANTPETGILIDGDPATHIESDPPADDSTVASTPH